MDTLYALVKVQAALILIGYCILLTMQAVAYRRYRHVSFVWLFLSTVIGVAGLFVASLTYFVRDQMRIRASLGDVIVYFQPVDVAVPLLRTKPDAQSVTPVSYTHLDVYKRQAQTHPRARRMYAAHLNAFEAFAPFAAGVLAAQAAGVDPARIVPLSIAFVVCRVLHGVFYLTNVHALRSLVWFAGFGCALALLAQAAMKAA